MSNYTQLPAEVVKCPECGGLNGGHGNRRCSLMTLEYAQQEIINVEQKWIQICVDNNRRHQKSFDRLKKDLTFFQSKVAALKVENNKLRKRATEYATKLLLVEQEIGILKRSISTHQRSYNALSIQKDELETKCERYENLIQNILDYIGECKGSTISVENRITAIENTLSRALSAGEGEREAGFDYKSREFEKGKPAPEGAIKAMHERWRITGERVECECGRWIVPADGCPDCINQKEDKQ
jgi:hypothetical protein